MDLIDPETGEILNHKGRRLDHAGREIPDPTIVPPPLGYKKQPTMAEYIRNMIRGEKLRQEAEAAGAETFEEADDFEVGDDYDPQSPYEGNFDPIDVQALQAEVARRKAGTERAGFKSGDPNRQTSSEYQEEKPTSQPSQSKPAEGAGTS